MSTPQHQPDLSTALDAIARGAARAHDTRSDQGRGLAVEEIRASARRRRLRTGATTLAAAAVVVGGVAVGAAAVTGALGTDTPPPAGPVTPAPTTEPEPTDEPTTPEPEPTAPEPSTPPVTEVWAPAWERCGDPATMDVTDPELGSWIDGGPGGGVTQVPDAAAPATITVDLSGEASREVSARFVDAWVVQWAEPGDEALFEGYIVGMTRGLDAPVVQGAAGGDSRLPVGAELELLDCADPSGATPLPAGSYDLLVNLMVTVDGVERPQWGWHTVEVG